MVNAPTTAIGRVVSPYGTEAEDTHELQWPWSVLVYNRMRRQDPQVMSVLRAIKLPIRRTAWRLDPNGARDEVVQFCANNLGLPIVGTDPGPVPRLRDRFSWNEHLALVLTKLDFGFSIFEQNYRITPDNTRAELRKLLWLPPLSITDFDVADDGGLNSVTQFASSRPIPVNRLVAHVNEREGGNWVGTSLLRPAYKMWLLKDRALRTQAQMIERNGLGIPLYQGQDWSAIAERYDPDTLKQLQADELAAGLKVATSWRSGDEAGAAIPHGAHLSLQGVQGALPDADKPIRYYDEQIARAVLAHFLNLGTQTGSWALGSTFADFFTMSLQTVALDIATTANMHLVEDLVDVNFGESEPAPLIVFDEIGSTAPATAEALRTLVQAGVLTPDEPLEQYVRTRHHLPAADPDTAREVPAVASDAPSPAPNTNPDTTPGGVFL